MRTGGQSECVVHRCNSTHLLLLLIRSTGNPAPGCSLLYGGWL